MNSPDVVLIVLFMRADKPHGRSSGEIDAES